MSRHFLGEIELFDVAVEGSDAYLLAKARAGDGFAPGADVRVSFDPRDVLVFAGGATERAIDGVRRRFAIVRAGGRE